MQTHGARMRAIRVGFISILFFLFCVAGRQVPFLHKVIWKSVRFIVLIDWFRCSTRYYDLIIRSFSIGASIEMQIA